VVGGRRNGSGIGGEAAATPSGHRFAYVPGLDGIRAFAVLAVIAFHSNFSWIPGGFYGVDAFFVLSGFLITSLLVGEWRSERTIRMRQFWVRRARRLLPALLVLVLTIGAVCTIWPSVLLVPNLFKGALASVFYSANWYFMADHASYFHATTPPSPLLHTWSLAIEEQFYLAWPLIVLSVFRWRRPRRTRGNDELAAASDLSEQRHASDTRWDNRRLEVLMVLALVGAVASAAWMAVLAPHGGDVNRVYYGTDTRAQGLLVGAALAAAFARWGGVHGKVPRRAWAGLAVLGVSAVAAMWGLVPEGSTLAFHGGFLLASLAVAAVVAGVVRAPRGPVAAALGWGPIRYVGRISYGVYLWYWPVLLVMTTQRVHLSGYALFAAQVAVIITFAALSYKLVETPIRRGALPSWRGLVSVPVAVCASLVVAQVATFTPPSVASVPISRHVSLVSDGTRPVKVLLVGDSMAGTLGVGVGQMAPRYGIQLMNEGSPACSVSTTGLVKVLWYTVPPGKPCQTTDPDALFTQWRDWVDAYNPDVVVYLARSDLFDQQVNGQWTQPGQAQFDQYLRQRLQQAIGVLSSKGAAVVLLTTPYYDSGDVATGSQLPEDDPARVTIDNTIIRSAAQSEGLSSGGANVSVFDLGGALSPQGHFTQDVNGVDMRCSDGVHITALGGEQLAGSLLPRLDALGRSHEQTSPQGAWSGPPPPTVPAWYGQLPCN
jgi:peptidoglycan/LPS O-acetylase OafA/YrhL